MMRWKHFMATGFVLLVAACGSGTASKEAKSPGSGTGLTSKKEVSEKAKAEFDSGIAAFEQHDKKQSWKESTCKEVATLFLNAAEEQKEASGRPFPEAIYNAGLAYQRCGDDEDARKKFQEALDAESSFHRARAQLVLYEFQKTQDLDRAITELDQVIRDAKFQNVEALVSLAALQMERGSDQPSSDGENDLERAKLNLQRALAINDSFMPAFNQLAIYYMEQAKSKSAARKGRRRGLVVAGAKGASVNEQQLDLAALVASQAMQKNPFYAPIHNTAGLIQVQLKNYNAAVQSFAKARKLDPSFFEAHMNYAAVNLSFRGFGEAEKAYKDALKLKPEEFEAHLGLALAIRGQIDMSKGNRDKLLPEAEKHLMKARKLEPERPETYYNEAILTQEFKAKGVEEKDAIKMLRKAADIYDDFVKRAGGDSVFEEAVKRAKDRAQDARDTADFIEQGIDLKKQEEARLKEEAKRKKEEEKRKKEEEKAAAEKPAAEGEAPAAAPAP